VAPGSKGVPVRRCLKNSGTGRALAPGRGLVPPGGLGLCRLAVLSVTPGENLTIYDVCCVVFKQ